MHCLPNFEPEMKLTVTGFRSVVHVRTYTQSYAPRTLNVRSSNASCSVSAGGRSPSWLYFYATAAPRAFWGARGAWIWGRRPAPPWLRHPGKTLESTLALQRFLPVTVVPLIQGTPQRVTNIDWCQALASCFPLPIQRTPGEVSSAC